MPERRIFALASTLLLSACNSQPNIGQITADDLQHHHWILEAIDGPPLPEDGQSRPDIEIGERLIVNGRAGCNRYSGQGELKDERFRIAGMGSTRMACPPPREHIETIMTGVLSDWSQLSHENQVLILKSPDHELSFRLEDWK